MENQELTFDENLTSRDEFSVELQEPEINQTDNDINEQQIYNAIDEVEEPITPNEAIQQEPIQDEQVIPQQQILTIKANFGKGACQIVQEVTSTGKQDKIPATGGKLRLLLGRIYSIPVDCDRSVDSDSHGVKIFSDVADKIDVRFVKDGIAKIIPLKHNVFIEDQERICVLY